MIMIYGNPDCPYCQKAKDLVNDMLPLNEWIYTNLVEEPEVRARLIERGIKTVPAVYVDWTYIGGFQELEDYMFEKETATNDIQK